MKKSYVMTEALCLADSEKISLECRCNGTRFPSYYCLIDETECNNNCEYLGLKRAVAAVALIDENGITDDGEEYFGDFSMTSEEWHENETKWVRKCSSFIESIK